MLIWKAENVQRDGKAGTMPMLLISETTGFERGKAYVGIYQYDFTFFDEFGSESVEELIHKHNGQKDHYVSRPDVDLWLELHEFNSEKEAVTFIKEWWSSF